MARIHHVAKAQQRYKTVPVLDDDGNPKVTPVMRRNGEPKKTKRGVLVTRKVTKADKTQPLPPYTCGACRQPIEVGTPYKHVSIKSGPYGGQTLRRHAGCPTWKQSELTTSKMAGIYAAQEDFQEFIESDFESTDDVQDALNTAAEDIRAVAEEYRESADAIRDGFGHDTYQSEELDSKADEIEGWADEIEAADIPEMPEEEKDCAECSGSGDQECGSCDGSGQITLLLLEPGMDGYDELSENAEKTDECGDCGGTGQEDCENCSGSGQVERDDDDLDDWREEVRASVDVVDNCPV